MQKIIEIDGKSLTIDLIYELAIASPEQVIVKLSAQAKIAMQKSRDLVLKISQGEAPIYGINTGFGALSSKKIPLKDLEKLQINLVRSHCTGVGNPFSKKIVRAIMLLRANCLASGFSGVNPLLIEQLIEYINNDIIPFVPEKGSVGASGDLAPLSHIALTLLGEGKVYFKGELKKTSEVISALNITPVPFGPKDGLGLINGTAVMTALGAFGIVEAKHAMKLADIASMLTLDGMAGTAKAYDPRISQLKPHQGQINCSLNLNNLLVGSEIKDSHQDCDKVQDPYSLRCIPQVHGSCRQTLEQAILVLEVEINSVTDNPLVFVESEEVVSGGNFHGEALAFCMDYLSMGLAEICNISERRVEKLMNSSFSGLPPFLTKDAGLNSGLMIAHVTAAALTSENKYLCHPASVDSVPTSTDKEDHVSMGVTAGRKLHEVISNTKYCLAIEFLCNTQALEFQRPKKTSPALEAVHTVIRKLVPKIEEDRVFHDDLENIKKLITENTILSAVEKIIGPLK